MDAANQTALTSCPVPIGTRDVVTVAHGGGGRVMQRLIEQLFASAFELGDPGNRHDSAILTLPTPQSGAPRLAFTTDSYVVSPIFFPGGDIGRLSVYGTVNDLAMSGASPRWISLAFIIEEGFELSSLEQVVSSISAAARETGVQVVTGDTKVVNRGKGDGIFINTAGIGVIMHDRVISPVSIQEGDAILISGDIGRHGMAIMAAREGMQFESTISSDCAPLAEPILAMLQSGLELHCLRDLTRGGLGTALVELAEASGCSIEVDETAINIQADVLTACSLLGLDPLYVANEGCFVAFVPQCQAAGALDTMRAYSPSREAAKIGHVAASDGGRVVLKTALGTRRPIDMLSGEQLPRIC